MDIEVEEIIIETECPADDQVDKLLKQELDDEDEDFRWDEDDPFDEFKAPIKKIKKPRKRKGDSEEGGSSSKAKSYGPKYKKDWENIPQFKKWLSVSIIGPEYFYCKLCKIDAKCGKSEIMRHMASKKHVRNSQANGPAVTSFQGLVCPVFTPFERNHEINYSRIPDYGEYLRKSNVKAVLINDIVGEGLNLTVTERCLIVEEWAKVCEKQKVYLMVQVGGAPQKEVLRMVRHAVSKKVNALVILPDLYNRPVDHFDLLRYLKDIADHADTLPLWYHHYPTFTNVHIDMKKFLIDVAEIETFNGVIFNSSSLDEIVMASAINAKIKITVATDNGILGFMAHGFRSILSPALNFMPSTVIDACKDKISEARMAQKLINDVFDVISEHGHPVSAMKSAMNILSRFDVGVVRRPLVDIWRKQQEQMQNEFKSLGLYTFNVFT